MCPVWLTLGSLVREVGKWGRARQFLGRARRARRASTSRRQHLSTTKPPENIRFTCQSTEVMLLDNSKKVKDQMVGWPEYRHRGDLSPPTGPGTLQPGRTRPGAAAHPGCGGCPKILSNMSGRWWAHRATAWDELTHKRSPGLIYNREGGPSALTWTLAVAWVDDDETDEEQLKASLHSFPQQRQAGGASTEQRVDGQGDGRAHYKHKPNIKESKKSQRDKWNGDADTCLWL